MGGIVEVLTLVGSISSSKFFGLRDVWVTIFTKSFLLYVLVYTLLDHGSIILRPKFGLLNMYDAFGRIRQITSHFLRVNLDAQAIKIQYSDKTSAQIVSM